MDLYFKFKMWTEHIIPIAMICFWSLYFVWTYNIYKKRKKK